MAPVVLMDGGHEAPLRQLGCSDFDGHPLWISRYIVENPEALRQACQDYIQAGAEMVVSATYQASVENIQQCWGVTRQEALDVIKRGVTIYKEAVELERAKGNKRAVSVAACLGPYGASLHDGSEYAGGRYVDQLTLQQLVDWHRPKFEAVIEAGADCLLFCTIPSVKEAEALLTLLKEYRGMKAILSFSAQPTDVGSLPLTRSWPLESTAYTLGVEPLLRSIKETDPDAPLLQNETNISHGERLCDAAHRCWQLASDQILAIGVNCLHPRLVEPLLRSIRETDPDIPLFVRVNTTEVFNIKSKQWEATGDVRTLPEYFQDWLEDLGLNYISGCCRTSVEDIANFRHEIEKFFYKSS